MGLFSFLSRSNNKSKEMIKLSKEYINMIDNKNNEKFEQAIREYYNYILKDEVLGSYVKKYNLTADEMVNYFNLLLANGYVEHKGYLIPTYVFSFAKPMDYFLSETKKGTPIYEIGYTLKKMI